MTFAVLPAQDGSPVGPTCGRAAHAVGLHRRRVSTVPVLEALPVTVLDAAAGRLSVPARPYLHNSFGAVQGGVVALMAEAAGAEALGAATGRRTARHGR